MNTINKIVIFSYFNYVVCFLCFKYHFFTINLKVKGTYKFIFMDCTYKATQNFNRYIGHYFKPLYVFRSKI